MEPGPRAGADEVTRPSPPTPGPLPRVGNWPRRAQNSRMTEPALRVDVEAHPLLRPAAFTTAFPGPLGELATPAWVLDLLDLDAEAPVQRDEALRQSVRDMLRIWGHKPAGRGKPASEYLVRAVGEGGLGSINLAVDICNAVSLHSGFPIALVDLARSRPPFRVAPGPEDGRYVFNAAGQEMSLEGLICLFDAEGPCGNPVKDAQRVKTDYATLETLTVLWGVAGYEAERDAGMAWYRGLLERVGGDTRPVPVHQPAAGTPG